MYKIKQKYEDFFVKEVTDLETSKKGNYSYYLLRKRNWSTLNAINKIASMLGIKNSWIGLAGNKDKWAVTEQYISIYKVPRERVETLKIKDINLEFKAYGNEKINLGSLEGNKFDIIVRNLEEKNKLYADKVENYFDEQRFGFKLNTHLVGQAIVKNDFKKACEILGLKAEGNDYVGELRKDDRRTLRFYVHAYESWLWNRAVSIYLADKYKIERKIKIAGEELVLVNDGKQEEIPIIGYLMKEKDDEIGRIYSKLMEEEGITTKDFIIKQIPEISSEGGKRNLFLEVDDFEYEYDKDEMNKGKYKARLTFFLGKGAYATMVIKRLFG